jgi:putative RNA 2'-phosphotransferase
MELSKLSKAASHALRHEPWLYELELDAAGWVAVEDLLTALQAANPSWPPLARGHLIQMIATSDKKRHEINGERVRALYGHSTPQKLMAETAVPPTILYHGTSPKAAALIAESGLQPMGRQYVHLSIDIATATEVGRRKDAQPIILRIAATEALADGVTFYQGNEMVWLADSIPAKFIS